MCVTLLPLFYPAGPSLQTKHTECCCEPATESCAFTRALHLEETALSNEHLLTSALYLLGAMTLLVIFSRQLGLGSILGLLIAGIIVGPHSPGPVWTGNVEGARHIAEFGVVLLLFLIGIEMHPSKLWKMRREVFGLGLAQILFSTIVIFAYVESYTIDWRAALVIGLAFSLSSTAFVMQMLQERGLTFTAMGQSSFAVLLMQDIAVVPMLALAPILADEGTLATGFALEVKILIAAGLIFVVLGLGRYVLPRVLDFAAHRQNRDAFFFTVMFSVVLAAWAMEVAGLSMALGAFLMGMMLSTSRYHFQIQAFVEPYKGLLMSLFFVAVGMSIDLGAILQEPLVLAQHLIMIMGIKILVLLGLMLLFRHAASTAVSVAFLMAQSGEFGFVLFGAAKGLGVISDTMFVAAIAIISFSMLLTPLCMRLGEMLARRLEPVATPVDAEVPESVEYTVVIAGFGRVGQMVAAMLHEADIRYIAFDLDARRVDAGRKAGQPVYFGNIADQALLSKIGLDRASLLIVAVDNHQTTTGIINHVRTFCPALKIIARTRNLRTRDQLVQQGATWAMPEAVEGSLRLGAEALMTLGRSNEEVQEMLEYYRRDDYAMTETT